MKKQILVLGKGKSGKAACYLLNKQGHKTICVDDTDDVFNEEEFSSFLFCVASPGFAPHNKWILACKNAGLKVISELDLGLLYCKSKNIVAVTGTNGKTTIVTLTSKLLETQQKTHLLGNVGIPLSAEVENIEKMDDVVLEVSSFMLYQSQRLHPKIAIISNITPDHKEWHQTHENYVESKLKILENQTSNDYCIFAADDPMLRTYLSRAKSKILLVSNFGKVEGVYIENNNIIFSAFNIHEVVAKVQDICICGKHNQVNALMAILAAKLMGISNKNIANSLRSFKGLDHRIKTVATKNGITFVDDSKSTNPESTIKAAEAMLGKSIVLMLGGFDKGLDVQEFVDKATKLAKQTVMFGPAGKRFFDVAMDQKAKNTVLAKNFTEAFLLATKIAERGDVVLLSPGCSSFDEFSSYSERGKKFEQLVESVEEQTKKNNTKKAKV